MNCRLLSDINAYGHMLLIFGCCFDAAAVIVTHIDPLLGPPTVINAHPTQGEYKFLALPQTH